MLGQPSKHCFEVGAKEKSLFDILERCKVA
jgi:hypothetical protein